MDRRISDAELDVMETLWASDGPLTAADVADRIETHRDWSLATVKTMLSRLAAKGAVSHAEDGRRFLYLPMHGGNSKQAPAFPVNQGPTPYGSIMALADGSSRVIGGRYEDRYVKRDGRWLYVSRVFSLVAEYQPKDA